MDVNLLPPQAKTYIHSLVRVQHLKLYTLLVLMICTSCVGALAVFRAMQSSIFDDVVLEVNNTLNVGSLSTYTQVEEQISEANKIFSIITTLHEQRIVWFDDFERVIALIPSEVRMRGFEIDSNEQSIILFGFAPLRIQVTKLEDNLKQLEGYVLTQAPLSNITKREDVNFSFRIQRAEAFAANLGQ